MTRYGEEFELNQGLMDAIANYMDDDIRENLHGDLAPCEPKLFLCAYLYRSPDFWKLLRDEFDISISDEEIISTLMRASDVWIPELNEKLCQLAGLEEEYKVADEETFEDVIEKAADILGVEIY